PVRSFRESSGYPQEPGCRPAGRRRPSGPVLLRRSCRAEWSWSRRLSPRGREPGLRRLKANLSLTSFVTPQSALPYSSTINFILIQGWMVQVGSYSPGVVGAVHNLLTVWLG